MAADGDATRAPTAAEQKSLVESFCAVTSATPDEAALFLESHNWALESAVHSFYDADLPDPAPQTAIPPAEDGANDEDYAGGEEEDEVPALADAATAVDERRRLAKRHKSSNQARGGSGDANGSGTVRTLSDLGGKGVAGSNVDEDSEDEEWAPPSELQTGDEKSGMVVRNRSKRKKVVDEVFKQAMKNGAKQGPAHQRSSSSRSFSGSSRLLTGDTVQPDVPQQPEEIVHTIYFWSDGFTVDDGPLRSFNDPEHASFLKSIKNSECPAELVPADGSSKGNVNIVLKQEKCPVSIQEPVKHAAPFEEGGQTLGTLSGNSAPSSAPSASSSETTTKTKTIMVDDSLPSTSLQIRFADGSRVVARFNTSHMISDVRAFVDATRPGEASDYTLLAGFPPKPLVDMTKTIEEAGVANSVLIQKV